VTFAAVPNRPRAAGGTPILALSIYISMVYPMHWIDNYTNVSKLDKVKKTTAAMKEFFYTDYKQRIYKRILCYKYTAEGEMPSAIIF